MSKVVVLYDYRPSDRAGKCTQEAPHRGKANLAEGQRLSHTGMLDSISTTSCRLDPPAQRVRSLAHAGSCAREDQGRVAMGVAGVTPVPVRRRTAFSRGRYSKNERSQNR